MPRRRICPRLMSAALLCLFLLTGAAPARENPAGLCLDAAAEAAARTGVPYDVLVAIAKVETGRNNEPWPWTVSFGGEGRWFDTAKEAEASVAEAIDQGATNFDLGCFQLNYRWHAKGFASLADMLDPQKNATYAAKFLAKHFAQTGDWALAAAAYHSATPKYAAAYQAKFEEVYAGTTNDTAPLRRDPAKAERRNTFPLLVAGATGAYGSLVPSASGGIPLIGTP